MEKEKWKPHDVTDEERFPPMPIQNKERWTETKIKIRNLYTKKQFTTNLRCHHEGQGVDVPCFTFKKVFIDNGVQKCDGLLFHVSPRLCSKQHEDA